jgi:hypothetical protein
VHIKPKVSQFPDMMGEFDITDYSLGFDHDGAVRHLNTHWGAIVHFCKTLDAAQDEAKQRIAQALSGISPADVDTSFMLEDELECATLADETLTKATIFIVLCSFKEFALKELYRQLENENPLPKKKGAFKHIKKLFMRKGLWPNDDESDGRLSEETYKTIRNTFAHGDWATLKKELPSLELHDEFGEVVGFLREIREHMCAKGWRL